jgi:site-specific DNA-methyltransferase (cytosine-N4-specific)
MAAGGVRAQMVVTSPPYWGLRDYGMTGQIGLEASLEEWLNSILEVMSAVRDVLADDGTLWLNLGDAYANDGKWGGETGGKQAYLPEETRRRNGRERRVTGLKPKNMMGQPWRVAFALQDEGWYLRSDIIWHKPNVMPESIEDRPTKAHEYVFLFAKSDRYHYDAAAISEPASVESHARAARGRSDHHKWAGGGPGDQTIAKKTPVAGRKRDVGIGANARPRKAVPNRYNDSFDSAVTDVVAYRNARTVWTIPTQPFSGGHFATFPEDLVARCILAGSRPGDVVLDPFMGSGTVAKVATDLARSYIGCELNPAYVELHELRRTTIGMPI